MNIIPWLPKYTPCNKCIQGYIHEKEVATKCFCRIEYEISLSLIQKYIDSNLLFCSSSFEQFEMLENYKLSNYKGPDSTNNKEKIEKYINKFKEKYNSTNLFFSGCPGTQKTTIAKYILSSILQKELTGYYVLANDLIRLLIDVERDKEKRDLIHYILSSDLLIIDEMDAQKIITYQSQYQQKHFLPFLKNRLETVRKSTIFISNCLPSDLGDVFKGAIQDVIERETSKGLLLFKDKYLVYKEKVQFDNIWDD